MQTYSRTFERFTILASCSQYFCRFGWALIASDKQVHVYQRGGGLAPLVSMVYLFNRNVFEFDSCVKSTHSISLESAVHWLSGDTVKFEADIWV